MSTAKPLRRHHLEILELLSHGCTTRQIAEHLQHPFGTVKDWMGQIQRRLGAQNTANAVALAMASGLIKGPGPTSVEVSP